MKSVLIHRVLLALAFAGLFVAATLSLGHILGKSIPCGVTPTAGISGCDAVSRHPSSMWFGQPVAYFGIVGYLVFVVLGLLRAKSGLEQGRKFTLLGFVLSLFGTVVSGYLVYTSLFVIGATCMWCMASAVIMALTFILHGLLLQTDVPGEPLLSGDLALVGALAIAAIGGTGVMAGQISNAGKTAVPLTSLQREMTMDKLSMPDSFFRGNPKARLTIIEFADFFCPACRAAYPQIKSLEGTYGDKVRFAFANYPLVGHPGHENSLIAAGASIFASEKGKYWDFVDVVFSSDEDAVNSPAGINAALKRVGLDPKEFETRWKAADDKLLDPIANVQATAQKYGVDRTPTLLVFRDGAQPVFVYEKIGEVLQKPEFQEYLK